MKKHNVLLLLIAILSIFSAKAEIIHTVLQSEGINHLSSSNESQQYYFDNNLGSFQFFLDTIYVSDISIVASDTIYVNQETQVSANITPSDATTKIVSWEIQKISGDAQVSNTGVLIGLSEGSINLMATATDGSEQASEKIIQIIVPTVPVESIYVYTEKASFEEGDTGQFYADVLPINADKSDIEWSVEAITGSASIDQSGLVTAISEGEVAIWAKSTDGTNISASKNIFITQPIIQIDSIVLSASSTQVTVDDTLQIQAQIFPANATNKNVIWQIIADTGNATINSSGLITGVSSGNITVIAKSSANSLIYGSISIDVLDPIISVESIVVSSDKDTIYTNEVESFTAIVLPSDATNKSVVWEVINITGIASINQSGNLTASQEGNIIVKAKSTDNNVIGEKEITILKQIIPATSLTISSDKDTIYSNDSLVFTGTILPNNSTSQEITWTVENITGDATISESGILFTTLAGKVRVKGTVTGTTIFDEKDIYILTKPVEIEKIFVSSENYLVFEGETEAFSIIVFPQNSSVKDVTWSVENTEGQAEINQNGILTAKSQGEVIVVATSKTNIDVVGKKSIKILQPVVFTEKIIVQSDNSVLLVSQIQQMNALVLPENTSDKNIFWSLDSDIASINQNGKLIALAAGDVTVSAYSIDGSNTYGSKVISIIPPQIPATSIEIITPENRSTIGIDGTLQCRTILKPDDVTIKKIFWSIKEGTDLATIYQDGLLTASSGGKVTIEARTTDGTNIYATKEITISKWYTGTEDKDNHQILFGPNPVKDVINFYNLQSNDILKVSIFQKNAQLVKEGTVENNQFSVDDLPKGLYFIKIEHKNGTEVQKFVKVH